MNVYLNLFILYPKKRGGLGVQNFFFHESQILAIKMTAFFKLAHFSKPFLKTRRHDRSAHTFGSSHQFFEVLQKGFLKTLFFLHFFTKVVALIRSTKTQFKNLKFDMVVNWHTLFFFVDTDFFSELKKWGLRGP